MFPTRFGTADVPRRHSRLDFRHSDAALLRERAAVDSGGHALRSAHFPGWSPWPAVGCVDASSTALDGAAVRGLQARRARIGAWRSSGSALSAILAQPITDTSGGFERAETGPIPILSGDPTCDLSTPDAPSERQLLL